MVERFGRAVMMYALSPSEDDRQNCEAIAAELAKRPQSPSTAGGLAHLTQHGQQMVERITALEGVRKQWVELGSGPLLDRLSTGYTHAHTAAVARAAVYRQGLYALALLVAAYLIGMFVVLERARQSLASAHAETAHAWRRNWRQSGSSNCIQPRSGIRTMASPSQMPRATSWT